MNLAFCAPDIRRSKTTGIGRINKQISEQIFRAASATNIAERSMQLPLAEISHALPIGRQEKTKVQIMTKDPMIIKAATASKT